MDLNYILLGIVGLLFCVYCLNFSSREGQENWNEKLLNRWKSLVKSVIQYHYSHMSSPLRQITTEFIGPTDYGAGFKYSIFDNNVACAKWIRNIIKETKEVK